MMPACSSAPESTTTPEVQSRTEEIVAPLLLEGALVAIPTTVDGRTSLRHIYIHEGKAYVHEGTWDEKEKFVKESLEGTPLPKPRIPVKLPTSPNKFASNGRYEWYVDSSNQAWSLATDNYQGPVDFKYIPHGKKAEIYIVFTGRRYSMISAKSGHTTPATFEITSRNGNVYSGRFINSHLCCPDFEGDPESYGVPLTTITIYTNESAVASLRRSISNEQGADKLVNQGYQELQQLAASASQQFSGFSPDSVKGKTIVFDQRKVLSRTGDNSGARTAWKADSNGIKSFSFKTGNSFTKLPDYPEDDWRDRVTYTKTGPNTATVKVEYFESYDEYNLTFTNATSGTLFVSGGGEGMVAEWKGGTFTIK